MNLQQKIKALEYDKSLVGLAYPAGFSDARYKAAALAASQDALMQQMVRALATADLTFAESGLLACHAARREILAALRAHKEQQ